MNQGSAQKILKKVKKDYKTIASDFNISRKKMFWQELNVLVKKYVREEQSVLDIGCGNGRLLMILKNKNINYIGTDNCKELLDNAREEFKDYNKKEFRKEDLLDTNYKEEFDLVFLIAVLQHIPTEKLRIKALKNIRKALKPNSFLIMLNWNLFQKNKIKYVKKYNKLRLEKKIDLGENDTLIPWKEFRNSYSKKSNKSQEILRYYHAFTKEETKKLLKEAGFKIEDIYYVKKGERVGIEEGYNLCTIAQKVQ